jgi:2-hydroxychromene-2-carboxylate isomerase
MTVEFHFDFGSPNAYFCHKLIPKIESRTGVTFEYVPVLLGGVFKMTNNRSPTVAFADIKNKQEYNRLETRRFIEKHKLTAYQRNPINSLQIMRGAVAAKADGYFAEYVAAVYHHMWENPKKMDEPDVIQAALSASALDGERTMSRIQDQTVKDTLLRNTAASVGRGAFGIPTFFVGNEIYFGKDRLRDVEEAIMACGA